MSKFLSLLLYRQHCQGANFLSLAALPGSWQPCLGLGSLLRCGRDEGEGMAPAFRTAEAQAAVTDHSTW
jgi:hypothetical protein